MADEVKYSRTGLRIIKGKLCITQLAPEDTPNARLVRGIFALRGENSPTGTYPCARGRVCSGICCPCRPHVYSTQEQL